MRAPVSQATRVRCGVLAAALQLLMGSMMRSPVFAQDAEPGVAYSY